MAAHLAADPVGAVNGAMGNKIAGMLRGRNGFVVEFKGKFRM